jgi:hypothetical protein
MPFARQLVAAHFPRAASSESRRAGRGDRSDGARVLLSRERRSQLAAQMIEARTQRQAPTVVELEL